MKEKSLSATERSINAILEDEEMEEYFRKLVEKANSKGLCLTNLQKASRYFWDKYSPETVSESQEQEVTFTVKETEFFEKLDAFWEKFGEKIMVFLAEHRPKSPYNKNCYSDPNFYKVLFKTMYLVFEKEDSVTIALLENYENQYFHTSNFHLDKTLSGDLYYLFNCCFYFKEDESGKIHLLFFPKHWEAYQEKTRPFFEHPDFKEFQAKYKASSRSFSKIALYMIWLVNEFF